MKLLRIGHANDVDGVTNRGELLMGDLLRDGVFVLDVQTAKDFAARVLPFKNLELIGKADARAVRGGLHLAMIHDNVIPIGGKGLEGLLGGDVGGVEVKCGHGFSG